MDSPYIDLSDELERMPTAEVDEPTTISQTPTQVEQRDSEFWAHSGFIFCVGHAPVDTLDEILQLDELCKAERLISSSSIPSAKLRKLVSHRTVGSGGTLSAQNSRPRPDEVKCRIGLPDFSSGSDDDTEYMSVWRGDIHEWVDVPVAIVPDVDEVSEVSGSSGSEKQFAIPMRGRPAAEMSGEDTSENESSGSKGGRTKRMMKRLGAKLSKVRSKVEAFRRSPKL